MTPERRAILDAAGSVEVDSAEFFGLSEADARVAEFRAALAREVRQLREGRGLSQRELAKLLDISQSRIPLIERGEASIEATAKAIVKLGGKLLNPPTPRPSRMVPGKRRPQKQPRMAMPVHKPLGLARYKVARHLIGV